MSLFDDNITTHPLDSLNEISHKAVTSVIRDSKRWYILDEEWLGGRAIEYTAFLTQFHVGISGIINESVQQ
jgi:hypothetical protein